MATTMTRRAAAEAPEASLQQRVVAGHREHLFAAETRLYDEPIVAVRGRGVWLEAADGRTYLDYFSGILTTSVGHCNPEVVARVSEQMETLGHTSTLYLNENEVLMAERLASIAPGRLKRTF